jgi:HSP20 family protein
MNSDVTKIRKDVFNRDERVITPPVDICETVNEYVIKADMPGVKKDKINIVLDKNRLEITGSPDEDVEKNDDLKYGEYSLLNYHRSFTVGNDIDGDRITANMDNGVLTLTLQKKEEVKPRKIEIAAG